MTRSRFTCNRGVADFAPLPHDPSHEKETLTFYLEYPRAIPINDRLVADVYDEVKAFEVPFKLENLSLLGAPLNPTK